jgi:phosphoribosylanthranilate isomerase
MNPPNYTVKVCGITRAQDAEMCLSKDVRWIGLNLYDESPRHVDLAKAKELLKHIPVGQRVYVDVTPSLSKLHTIVEMGFDRYQIHFDYNETTKSKIEDWADAVKPENLWLAPRLPHHAAFPLDILPFAWHFVVDGFSSGSFGGTGTTANWRHFRALKDTHQEKGWILAGGLRASNIKEAIESSGAHFIDLNSGVETEPGIKDHSKLQNVLELIG